MRRFGQVGRGQRRKSRWVAVVTAGLLGVGLSLVVSGGLFSLASANTPSSGNLDQVRAELRELNHKLARAIQRLEGAKRGGIDVARERRTLNDLEATKLRAVDQFPTVLKPHDCIRRTVAAIHRGSHSAPYRRSRFHA